MQLWKTFVSAGNVDFKTATVDGVALGKLTSAGAVAAATFAHWSCGTARAQWDVATGTAVATTDVSALPTLVALAWRETCSAAAVVPAAARGLGGLFESTPAQVATRTFAIWTAVGVRVATRLTGQVVCFNIVSDEESNYH